MIVGVWLVVAGMNSVCRPRPPTFVSKLSVFASHDLPSPISHFPSSNERLGLACNQASAVLATRDAVD